MLSKGPSFGLPERYGRQTPLNARLRKLILDAEAAGNGPPGLSPADIRA